MREVHSPPPQPEDPDRALDPGLEEDPDTFVELIDRMFYQLSCDGTLVAIIADYPGLLPASHVSKNGALTSKKDPFFCTSPTAHIWRFTGKALGMPRQTRGDSPARGIETDRLKRKVVRTKTPL